MYKTPIFSPNGVSLGKICLLFFSPYQGGRIAFCVNFWPCVFGDCLLRPPLALIFQYPSIMLI